MKIEKFIEELNGSQNKVAYVREHVVIDYVPYTQKVSLCYRVAEYTTHSQVQDKKVFHVDSAMRYMLFVYAIIETYTDIELGRDEERIKAFDLLEKYNVMSFIVDVLGDEYTRLDTILKMQVDDIYGNERDITSFIETKIEALGLVTERMDKINEQENQRHISTEEKGS